MTKDEPQDLPPVAGDPILLHVLAAAQRFAAWYAEYLSVGAAPAGYSGPAAEQRVDEVVRHLQHAVFDLMAAVHAMNRHCSGQAAASEAPKRRSLAVARTAVH
ncbi:hypothetical protein KO353_13370 [Elioraea tepida]|jgi:hypothetical protein|uniref:Uncharacterized protein n=1 Tax=Elioraea tepida TaxID=2843330 RepID=A0A975YJ51_9PROT|nr:hypothetical protein [Elioraea tepida]QXM24236.1 hypothetical protein KO353_13370 [Elioraea tepida]